MPERFTPEEHRSLAGAPADSGLVPGEEEAPAPPADGVVEDDDEDASPA